MSKKLKLSPWHDGSVRPVHVGLYEVYEERCDHAWSWFDGIAWGYTASDKKTAVDRKYDPTWTQNKQWRGVLK